MDEILEFAELTEHVHTRVEHLSFGIRQRLFFAVMLQTMKLDKAHIYLFDEWLSGSDKRFQDKAESEALAVQERDALIVYASHDLDRLRRSAERAIYLKDGRILDVGDTDAVIDRYLEECGGGE